MLDGSPGTAPPATPILTSQVLFEVHPATGAMTLSTWSECYDMGCYGSARTSFSSPSSIIPSPSSIMPRRLLARRREHTENGVWAEHGVWAAVKERGRCRTEQPPDGADAPPLPLLPIGGATWPRGVMPHAGAPAGSVADRSNSRSSSDVSAHAPSEPVPIHGGARITFPPEALASSGDAAGVAAWAAAHGVVAYRWATADRSDEDDHALEVEAVDSTPCALAQGDARVQYNVHVLYKQILRANLQADPRKDEPT